MSTELHPAFDSMLAAAQGVLKAHRPDLEQHDRRFMSELDPRESFVWIVGECATHLVAESHGDDLREVYRDAFHPKTGSCRSESNRVYFWDGRQLQAMGHDVAFERLKPADA